MFKNIKARIIAFIRAETQKALVTCSYDFEQGFKSVVSGHVESVFAVERTKFEARVALFKEELITIEKELREKFVATLKEPADLLKEHPSHWRADEETLKADHALRKPPK